MSNRRSQAEEYAEAHCDTLVDWLKNNTKPCACAEKYTRCETNGACFGLDEKRRLLCRRCYVPSRACLCRLKKIMRSSYTSEM